MTVEIQGQEFDDEMAHIIAPYRLDLAAEMDVILCENKNDMTKARPESALGNFFSDACLSVARDLYDGQIDAALFNTGGIRSSLASGPVTVGDIYNLMPFDNELVVVELAYEEIMTMSDYIARTGGEPIAGMRIELKDSIVSAITIGDLAPEERNYFILTSDYLSAGGDRMDFFTEGSRLSIRNLGIKVRDALIRRCSETKSEGNSIDYTIDGRVSKE